MRQKKASIAIVLMLVSILSTYLLAQYVQTQWPKRTVLEETGDVSYESSIKKRLPKAIIIGAQKGGTRALISFLAHHPSIAAADMEINFFSKRTISDSNDVSYERYREQMPLSLANQITMEKSPSYFHTEYAPRRMYKYQQYLGTKLKLILTLVHPVRRSVSHFFHKLRKDDEEKTMKTHNLTEALSKPLKGNHYLQISLYGKHFSNWLRYFTLDQFLIINGTTLGHENPSTTLKKCEHFLGLPNYFTEKMFKYQPEKGFYCHGQTANGCLGAGKGQRSYPQELPQEVFQKLEEMFASDQFLLFNLTALNFSRIL